MRPVALESAKARQWPQYRREFMTALRAGLKARGFGGPSALPARGNLQGQQVA
jgi:hypothetical protein